MAFRARWKTTLALVLLAAPGCGDDTAGTGGSGGAGGAGMPTNSTAPLSQAAFCGLLTPCWSVAGQGSTPPSTARLSARSACVRVGPPLSASASSARLVFMWSRGPWKEQALPLSMLPPSELTAASQLPPNARKEISFYVVRSMPALNQLCDKVLASPEAAPLAKPAIDALRVRLEELSRS